MLTVAQQVVHPPVDLEHWEHVQERFGGRLPIEVVDGQGVLMRPIGEHHSMTDTALRVAFWTWTRAQQRQWLLFNDVFVRIEGERYAADLSVSSPTLPGFAFPVAELRQDPPPRVG